jgi:hypothetical protein
MASGNETRWDMCPTCKLVAACCHRVELAHGAFMWASWQPTILVLCVWYRSHDALNCSGTAAAQRLASQSAQY